MFVCSILNVNETNNHHDSYFIFCVNVWERAVFFYICDFFCCFFSLQLTGPIQVLHQARACVDSKGGKNELTVKQGDQIEIIRLTDNPEGKWLGRIKGCCKFCFFIVLLNVFTIR